MLRLPWVQIGCAPCLHVDCVQIGPSSICVMDSRPVAAYSPWRWCSQTGGTLIKSEVILFPDLPCGCLCPSARCQHWHLHWP